MEIICESSCLPIPMVPRLHQCNGYTRKRTYHCGVVKYPVSWGAVKVGEWKCVKIRVYQSPWYRVFTKAMVISNGSYMYRELKNVLPSSVQKTYLALRGHRVSHFIRGSIEPRMEIYEISCLPIPMVPRLHKSNGYIKRKLRVWRAQKCIALVCAQSVPTTALR